MSSPAVDLVFLWHHHQPDYRSPRDGRALLPWVRLHATKDYLDMALRLERFPRVRATFNFVPSLLDQLDDAVAGKPDVLLDLLDADPSALATDQRDYVRQRCRIVPRWARERFRAWSRLADRLGRSRESASDHELIQLQTGFLLGWLDPMFFAEPVAAEALTTVERGSATVEQRDALMALHRTLTARVVPAYRALAEKGQIELSESAYYHPILPLLCDIRALQRARPDLPLPGEPFAAPEDAARQVRRGLDRHERAFGVRPSGVWPSEGSVSPEAAAVLAEAGVRWAATDEGVLWHSIPPGDRQRHRLYQPWVYESAKGPLALFFRDRELSDRIGFVYARWDAREAVKDFMARLSRAGEEWRAKGGQGPAVVSVILDGENCWETYADDGAPFLDALYEALSESSEVRTTTPSAVLAEHAPSALPGLHTGSWIDADFHIWAGHPEKNRAWELVARARQALVDAGATPESQPAAWESLSAAEGSDWFWWFGEDHYTPDKPLFDRIFREHVQSVYEKAGLSVPAWVGVPITRGGAAAAHRAPIGFLAPVLDGRSTHFYEWHEAGHYRVGAGGGSMHHGAASLVAGLHYGFDEHSLYLRLDFPDKQLPGGDVELLLDVLVPPSSRLLVRGLTAGERPVLREREGGVTEPVPGARCVVGDVLELGVPFTAFGAKTGDRVELLLHLVRGREHLESIPPDQVIRVTAPGGEFDAAMWTA